MPLHYDPEFYKALEPQIPLLYANPKPPVHDVAGRRARLSTLLAEILPGVPDTPDVDVSLHQVKAPDGASVAVSRYVKKDSDSGKIPVPAILEIHGGGMICGDVASMDKVLKMQASESGIQVFAVGYRLAPEHKDPTLVEDCYAALEWMNQNAQTFNIDPKRIAVKGGSAGGGLAAGVALLARDRGLSPPLAKQILISPMLDDRNLTPNLALEQFATWNNEDNITGWTALLGDQAGGDGVSCYAAPARVESVEGLPPTYIDIGGLDIFRDEVFKYAARIAEANIPIEFHLYPGVPHSFEGVGGGLEVTKMAKANRLKAIKAF
ncbi:hypothetical protein PV08_00795 [Exophiala spinifera]|uniref:Alpha/beta hydrolase fold-3 domain-containing protein n=1 Tax=Exophiala spinifera TaxID=91928 RepID=A0A0D2BNW3_9EURO|nr:uncharacterized protein PV08_00795 [Exophiala spinifera]KIW20220.1 hypothetical protein PV08_00795 [Exophiala spinifera]